MNKTELIQKIQSLDALTNDEKADLLALLRQSKKYGIVCQSKKYGLVWEDKPEAVETRLQTELPVLVEVSERAIINRGGQSVDNQQDIKPVPNHILIEGDNLEALTALSYTHAGKIDVIYIDPPYNTGNKDFVYNDSYVDREDSYRHSKWLSFMNKRLKIAKQLLSDRGVIFISIDDNEQANLKLLCDEVFGERNFVATLPRITKSSGKTTDKIALNHDYVMVITKSKDNCIIQGLPHDDEGFKFIDDHYNERGKYKLNQTLDYDSLSYSDSLDYPLEIEGEIFYPGGSKEKHEERKSGKHKRADWEWRWSQDLVKFGLENDFIVVKKTKNGSRIYTKTYQGVSIEKGSQGYTLVAKDRLKPVQSIDLINNEFSNDNAKKELSLIFEDIPFDYPKPTSILRHLLPTIPKVNYILDFFAGSGTTLHATMQLNAEDGGSRQCILVTNNENGICENVTYERNRRVIEGYTKPNGEKVEGLTNNSLRYYRTAFVGRERTTKNMRELMRLATDMLCIKENLYEEQDTFFGTPVDKESFRCFGNGRCQMMVIYNECDVNDIADMIYEADTPGRIKIYVFSPSEDPWQGDFEEVLDKVELCALPHAIYNAYRHILPKSAEPEPEPEGETENTAKPEDEGVEPAPADLFTNINTQD